MFVFILINEHKQLVLHPISSPSPDYQPEPNSSATSGTTLLWLLLIGGCGFEEVTVNCSSSSSFFSNCRTVLSISSDISSEGFGDSTDAVLAGDNTLCLSREFTASSLVPLLIGTCYSHNSLKQRINADTSRQYIYIYIYT